VKGRAAIALAFRKHASIMKRFSEYDRKALSKDRERQKVSPRGLNGWQE
jgi:hypothetical protein